MGPQLKATSRNRIRQEPDTPSPLKQQVTSLCQISLFPAILHHIWHHLTSYLCLLALYTTPTFCQCVKCCIYGCLTAGKKGVSSFHITRHKDEKDLKKKTKTARMLCLFIIPSYANFSSAVSPSGPSPEARAIQLELQKMQIQVPACPQHQ